MVFYPVGSGPGFRAVMYDPGSFTSWLWVVNPLVRSTAIGLRILFACYWSFRASSLTSQGTLKV